MTISPLSLASLSHFIHEIVRDTRERRIERATRVEEIKARNSLRESLTSVSVLWGARFEMLQKMQK
jgi:hypothetical protein